METQFYYICRYATLKELSHGVLSFFFGHVQNLLNMEGNLKIVVY